MGEDLEEDDEEEDTFRPENSRGLPNLITRARKLEYHTFFNARINHVLYARPRISEHLPLCVFESLDPEWV